MKSKLSLCLLLLALCMHAATGAEFKLVRGNDQPAIKKIGKKAEIVIFPVESRKKKVYPSAEKVLTGIFSGNPEQSLVNGKTASRTVTVSDSDKRQLPSRKKTAHTIAWTSKEDLAFHDPFLDTCSANVNISASATPTEKIWVNNPVDLCGLEPCASCYKLTDHPPAFIVKESGGLDVASTTGLLDNQAFVNWLQVHLPVRNPCFLSTRKLLIYPKLEMTETGLQQLVREVEQAYRRHTWKVIEVIGKKSELDTENISSFANPEQEP